MPIILILVVAVIYRITDLPGLRIGFSILDLLRNRESSIIDIPVVEEIVTEPSLNFKSEDDNEEAGEFNTIMDKDFFNLSGEDLMGYGRKKTGEEIK